MAAAAKAEARQQAVTALQKYEFAGKVKAVRVNACDSKWCYEDIISVVEGARDRLDCLIIPKVEDVDQVHFVHNLLNQIELKLGLTRQIGIELQIESARGMENIGAIAGASSRTETLVFGPADFLASLRVPELTVGRLKPEYPGDYWHYFLCRIVIAARAHGLQAIDGPYAQIRDVAGLRTFAERASMLGFDGKWAVNPLQIDILNSVFTPRQEDFDKATAILDAYRQATDVDGTGAVMLGDEMIDEASRKMAVVMIKRGEAFGMKAGRWSPLPSK